MSTERELATHAARPRTSDRDVARAAAPVGPGGAEARAPVDGRGHTVALDKAVAVASGEGASSDDGAEHDPRLGTVLADRYRLLERLGEGGMGAVYRAEHVTLRKSVAVKLLHSSLGADAEMVERFQREAQAAAELEHPNIVGATDYGRLPDGTLYLVMQHVAGRSLRAVLREAQGPLSLERARNVLRQLASALARAHAKEVVHRDLKPENVLLCPSDDGDEAGERVKVIDFGIARLVGSRAAGGQALTRAGTVFGTPEYMAPEQALGEAVDARGDQYALGVLAFELLTGRLPFESDELVEVLRMHVQVAPPAASEVNPRLGPEVDAALAKMLAKSRHERFASVREAVAALDEALARCEGAAPVPASALTSNPGAAPVSTPKGTASVAVAAGVGPGPFAAPSGQGPFSPAQASSPGWVAPAPSLHGAPAPSGVAGAPAAHAGASGAARALAAAQEAVRAAPGWLAKPGAAPAVALVVGLGLAGSVLAAGLQWALTPRGATRGGASLGAAVASSLATVRSAASASGAASRARRAPWSDALRAYGASPEVRAALAAAQRGAHGPALERAVAPLRARLRQAPDDVPAAYYLGAALYFSGSTGEALEAFERALARAPELANDDALAQGMVAALDLEGGGSARAEGLLRSPPLAGSSAALQALARGAVSLERHEARTRAARLAHGRASGLAPLAAARVAVRAAERCDELAAAMTALRATGPALEAAGDLAELTEERTCAGLVARRGLCRECGVVAEPR